MRIFLLALPLLFSSALPALAQRVASYQVDNFDIPGGIQLATPQPEAQLSKLSRGKTIRNRVKSASAESIKTLISKRLDEIKISNSLDGFTTGSPEVDNLIVESGNRNSVDPLLLYAIMHQESTFKRRAVSPKGARGLMQLMPQTASRYGVSNIFDPRQNIEGGARYMRFLLGLFEGDVNLALAGYNAGENAVIKYGYRIPPYNETQEYVRRISRRYSLIRDPLAARNANSMTREQLASIQQKEPLSIYERSVFAVRLPDGRLQLVSQ
jgi:soluble lytic murein transglycosylase-like protein